MSQSKRVENEKEGPRGGQRDGSQERKQWNALECCWMLRKVGGFESDWSRPSVMQEDGSSL
jgi:hypothetical protein